jgi:glycerate dehydrogenase
MKIVVLDGYALNPGDNPWDAVAALGELTVYDRTPRGGVLERAKDADILLTNKTPLDAGTIGALPKLKLISVLATGYNIVDTAAAAERGIPVCNVPTYGTDSVAQLVMALILEFCHNVRRHSDSVLAGDWCRAEDYSYWNFPLIELAGKTLGVVGYGAIGRRVAELAHAFGMRVLAYNTSPKPAPGYSDFAFADLDGVLRGSDFVSLHCPLTAKNAGMINAEAIEKMKPTAYLINTARGPLIDERALAEALNAGRIAGAALDVLSSEPPKGGNQLLSAKNIIVTPHIAWATLEARRRLMAITAENISAFLAGRPVNVVNGIKAG